jgi:RsiW-degrading membrane proteinase PrsW (M82 family)
MTTLLLGIILGFIPVLCFLGGLVYADTFKLVRFRDVGLTIMIGCAAAGSAMLVNMYLMDRTQLSLTSYSRYVAPFVEESLKAAYLVYLLRSNRVGFMVDAAIRGVALGAGFALVENLYYLALRPDAAPYLWVIRGFGTAIMHGGATALAAIIARGVSERAGHVRLRAIGSGLLGAILLHSLFNHFFLAPMLSTLLVLACVPLAVFAVYRRSETATREWLGVGFDSDQELLEMITTGTLTDTRIGRYLEAMQEKFPPAIVADMLCYLRIHLELSIRAKGLLMMRDAGFDVPADPEAREQFAELHYLERTIGKTGMIALHPFLRARAKDLWQITMLQANETKQ